jgi:hypothetical protein
MNAESRVASGLDQAHVAYDVDGFRVDVVLDGQVVRYNLADGEFSYTAFSVGGGVLQCSLPRTHVGGNEVEILKPISPIVRDVLNRAHRVYLSESIRGKAGLA